MLTNIGQNLWAYAVISDLSILIQVAGPQVRRYRLEAKVLETLEYITDCKQITVTGLSNSEDSRILEQGIRRQTTPHDWVRALVRVKVKGDNLLHHHKPEAILSIDNRKSGYP